MVGGSNSCASGGAVAGSAPVAADADPVVEQVLRTWRSERSRRDSVPAYIVLSNATLSGIAAAQPRSLAMLRRVDGIGPVKLDLYGEEILALLEGVVAASP